MSEKKSSGGIGFTGALQVAFIALKLCKVINWSWFWVLSPLWISAVLLFVLIVILAVLERREQKAETERWKEYFKKGHR